MGLELTRYAKKYIEVRNAIKTKEKAKDYPTSERKKDNKRLNLYRKQIKTLKATMHNTECKDDGDKSQATTNSSYLQKPYIKQMKQKEKKKRMLPHKSVINIKFPPFMQKDKPDRETQFMKGYYGSVEDLDDDEELGGLIGVVNQLFDQDNTIEVQPRDALQEGKIQHSAWSTRTTKPPESMTQAKVYAGSTYIGHKRQCNVQIETHHTKPIDKTLNTDVLTWCFGKQLEVEQDFINDIDAEEAGEFVYATTKGFNSEDFHKSLVGISDKFQETEVKYRFTHNPSTKTRGPSIHLYASSRTVADVRNLALALFTKKSEVFPLGEKMVFIPAADSRNLS